MCNMACIICHAHIWKSKENFDFGNLALLFHCLDPETQTWVIKLGC